MYATTSRSLPLKLDANVSLSAYATVDPTADDRRRGRARIAVGETFARFMRDTGWSPNVTHHVAGALLYTQYNFLVRIVMKAIARRAGRTTDTSRDHDFTDWGAVERFAEGFANDAIAKAPSRP